MTQASLSLVACAVMSAGWMYAAGGVRLAPDAAGVQPDAAVRHQLLAIEDARPAARPEAGPLLRALSHPSPAVAAQAVRALGRLERPEFLPDIARALADGSAGVRAEAANAMAQAVPGPAGAAAAAALESLSGRLAIERDPSVRAALCRALGRLPFASNDARLPVERQLALALDGEFSPPVVRLGAARGLESLVRRARGSGYAPAAETVRALQRAALGTARPFGADDEDRARRAALLTLNAAGAPDAIYERLALDRDAQIRRLALMGVAAAAAAGSSAALPDLGALIQRAIADPSPVVRYEALRIHGRARGGGRVAADSCSVELNAARDSHPHVALLAIDLLATACPSNADATAALEAILLAEPGPPAEGQRAKAGAPHPWQPGAHALVSLARRAPDRAGARIATFASDPSWHKREYAARAAAAAGDAATLATLAQDVHGNVRSAAIDGLASTKRHDADDAYLAALARPDYPVVLSAVRALEGTPQKADATAALLRALAALTAERRDTSRDPRLAILDRLRETGGADSAGALTVYLADPDPRVAARAAEIVTAWTGRTTVAATTRQRTLPVPDDVGHVPAGMRVTMGGGASFDVRFFTDEAPVTVWRVMRLVRQGYYNGLTYHRIVPNFIIQGGSPAANEYVGDGPFVRDELSLRSNDRGTVGLSTRGRDTGDAQWFINLVDNPRLDHDYTVFGEVVRGMDVVDAIGEGDEMVSIEPIESTEPIRPPVHGSRRSPRPRSR